MKAATRRAAKGGGPVDEDGSEPVAFRGIGSPLLKRASAAYQDFQNGQCDIWCWNINGFNAAVNKGTIQSFFSELDPTILCLNETKLQELTIDAKKFHEIVPEGYEQYWNCSTAKKGYSGTAIFTKVKPLWVQNDFDDKHNTEGRSISMEFEKFVLVCTYVPNS